MSEPTEREWLEGLRYEDKFPEGGAELGECRICGVDLVNESANVCRSCWSEVVVDQMLTAETADQAVALLREAVPHLLAWRSGALIDRIEALLATLGASNPEVAGPTNASPGVDT